jgi:prevent-host-death family protein
MPARVDVRELRQNLSKYLNRVKAGEALTVTEHGREVARLVPSTAGRLAGSVPSERLELIAARLVPPGAPGGTTDAFIAADRAAR